MSVWESTSTTRDVPAVPRLLVLALDDVDAQALADLLRRHAQTAPDLAERVLEELDVDVPMPIPYGLCDGNPCRLPRTHRTVRGPGSWTAQAVHDALSVTGKCEAYAWTTAAREVARGLSASVLGGCGWAVVRGVRGDLASRRAGSRGGIVIRHSGPRPGDGR